MHVRKMESADLPHVAQIHREAFPRQLHSEQWITCNFKAYPRIRYFVIENHNPFGYIEWIEKSGFRQKVVLELEQIAVLPSHQNRGAGSYLISQSLQLIQEELKLRDASIKHLLVTTRSDNSAQRLYKKALNAQAEVIIKDLFSADEVLMISRNFSPKSS